MTILDQILSGKVEEVARLRRQPGEATLRAEAAHASMPRGFGHALRVGPEPRVIAEIKRASPSKGTIRAGADPAEIARAYQEGGAAAISVLTDGPWFQGSIEDLRQARRVVELPILRKDFVVDPIQVLEARACGADAVLLIVAALDDACLRDLLDAVRAQGMDALVEVHTREELDRALAADAQILGINNRDLKTFRTDVAVTRELLPHTSGRTVVSESGIDDPATVAGLVAEGVHAFLIGELLMRAGDPGGALKALREGACHT